MYSVIKLFILITLVISQINASKVNNGELLSPQKQIWDFTYQSDIDAPQNNIINKYDKIRIEVDKIIGLIPRSFKTNSCDKDSYGNIYCNESLAQCAQEWDVEDGYSQMQTGTVVDYADKTLTESYEYIPLSNGWSYQTRYSKSYRGHGSRTYSIFGSYSIKLTASRTNQNSARIGLYYGSNKIIEAKMDSKTGYHSNYKFIAQLTNKGKGSASGYVNVYKKESNCPSGYTKINNSQCRKIVTTIQCPDGYTETTGSETGKGQCKKEITYTFYNYICSDLENSQNYNFNLDNAGGDCNKTDPSSTDTNTDLANPCNSTTPPKNNCKRKKFTCVSDNNRPCAKVDGDWKCSPFACNNEMECGYGTCNGQDTSNTEIMPYVYHPIEALTRSGSACTPIPCNSEYEYSDGTATKIDKKLCGGTVINNKCIESNYVNKITNTDIQPIIKTTNTRWFEHQIRYDWNGKNFVGAIQYNSSTCNTSYLKSDIRKPKNVAIGGYGYISNSAKGGDIVWQDVYICKVYSYGSKCPSGYTMKNNQCERTVSVCPEGYSEYGSATQCRKQTDIGFNEYSYYTYQCPTETNSFGNEWELLKENNDPGCLDDTFGGCTSFDKETAVCRSQIHTCPDGRGTCNKNSNGQYQCSLDGCDAERLPCVNQVCDLALNDKISYCEAPNCPTSFGVFEESGSCYVEQCPEGTVENYNGECIDE